jgi:hypothetical protein
MYEDKVDGLAADLEAAINDVIREPINELRWYAEIAIGSLVPLWIIALVALYRHQRERVDLAHLEGTPARPPLMSDDPILGCTGAA